MACAIGSRCVATAAGTDRSSAFISSTIWSGDARSISAVRGFRRSVSRESMNVMSHANLREAERMPQQQGRSDMFRHITCAALALVSALGAARGRRRCRELAPATTAPSPDIGLDSRSGIWKRSQIVDGQTGNTVAVWLHVANSGHLREDDAARRDCRRERRVRHGAADVSGIVIQFLQQLRRILPGERRHLTVYGVRSFWWRVWDFTRSIRSRPA